MFVHLDPTRGNCHQRCVTDSGYNLIKLDELKSHPELFGCGL